MPLTSGGTSTQTQAEARTTELVSQDQLGCTGQQQSRIDMQQAHVAGQALSGAEAGAETADTETEHERSSFVLPRAAGGTGTAMLHAQRKAASPARDLLTSTGPQRGSIDMQQPAAGYTGHGPHVAETGLNVPTRDHQARVHAEKRGSGPDPADAGQSGNGQQRGPKSKKKIFHNRRNGTCACDSEWSQCHHSKREISPRALT